MRIAQEETICTLFSFKAEDEAVEAANKTSMGLASYFFTRSGDRSWRLLENLEADIIRMNTGKSSAAESPYGGIKESGAARNQVNT